MSGELAKESLFGKDLRELEEFCRAEAWPRFRARQLYTAMYTQHCTDFAAMTVLGKKEREFLERRYHLAAYEALQVQVAEDATVKFLYPLHGEADGALQDIAAAVECVLIPNKADYTLCLSSQWGCRWACRFCRTGQMGFQRNLSTGEILAQLRCALLVKGHISRIVFMGMGEPLENPHLDKALAILSDGHGGYGYGARRITVSTVGLVQPLRRFFALPKPYRLAISVHNPIGAERSRLIPAERSSPLQEVLQVIKEHAEDKRRLTFEYTLVAGDNDQDYHAEALAKMAQELGARVNLIACHSIAGAAYAGSDAAQVRRFQNLLEARGIRCTIRKSCGEEIQAACGMLASP